ncbi:Ldh family oxidoreductase [Altererythrobacter arenosus]|uniref:Ldh family oxidoreductase n=1 Tax=Altererythrobacter arenosus TaxID=3032592 RepID=A0ABY8FMR9_9SPHN|nr:Ldh family oxidoreductase [Altererythrobacter sp. CAU 1644]WFL76298.1 Ldh family oxidoreductase [Altererythrobacter sp. CAU 1644]
MAEDTKPFRIARSELAAFINRLMAAAGVDEAQIATVSDNLVWNDASGRRNHGVERLPILLKRVQAGLIKCPAQETFQDLGPSIAHLDAGDAFGQHAGTLASDHAVALAKKTGIGVVGVSSSNFFGTGAYFLARMVDQGAIGLVLSNSYPKVAVPGGTRPALGTNPFAFGAPYAGGRLLVDMSTAAVAGSTIRDAQRAGIPLPEGIAVDEDGRPVIDPEKAQSATLLPAAGAKGFGLALMVEVLAGVLTGSGIAHEVGSLYANFDRASRSGHFFLALDISRWMDDAAWDGRMDLLIRTLAGASPGDELRLPGQMREMEQAESARLGIPIVATTADALRRLARELGVPPHQSLTDQST